MKKELRKEILKKRSSISLEEKKEKSNAMIGRILKSEAYGKAKRVFSYVNIGFEAETIPILEQAWKDGKAVAVPVAKQNREMYFVEIKSLGELKPTKFGVLEPERSKEWEVIPQKDDLFLVPGSVFDTKGNRFGYGGGYYDTYFERHHGFTKIGLAFELQVREESLPVEAFDKPMDYIVTEKRWIGGNKNEWFD